MTKVTEHVLPFVRRIKTVSYSIPDFLMPIS